MLRNAKRQKYLLVVMCSTFLQLETSEISASQGFMAHVFRIVVEFENGMNDYKVIIKIPTIASFYNMMSKVHEATELTTVRS